MSEQGDQAFRDHVLRWLRDGQHVKAASVEKVNAYGSDWAGSTQGGFYSQFNADIEYTGEDGKKYTKDVDGEAMGSLWSWVVGAWQQPEGQE